MKDHAPQFTRSLRHTREPYYPARWHVVALALMLTALAAAPVTVMVMLEALR